MDVASSSTSLFYQVFRLYRHISSARSFSDSAGALSTLIAAEYFRFESWVQASGLVHKDPASGEPIVPDHALRRCILLAADANWATMEYQTVEETVLGILSEVYRCLEKLNKLRGKYGLDLTSSGPSPSPAAASVVASPPASTGVPNLDSLFSSSRVSAALSRNAAVRQERSRSVSFFRKVNFSWSISDDLSDRVKIEETLKTLRDLNDRLESILPPFSSRPDNSGTDLTRRLVSLKMLSITAEPTELRAIGEITATHAGRGAELYQQIYNAATLKAMRLEGDVSQSELQSVVLEEKMLVTSPHTPTTQWKHKHTRTLCELRTDGSTTSTVLVEGTQFPDSLPDADIHLLQQRIAILAVLLKLAGQPYFKTLPSCHGYIRYSHTQFGLVYSLPDSADPNREPMPLYSLLPTTSRRDLSPFGMNKRIGRSNTLPTLEERYRLAHAIADAVLSLLSVSWVHKSLCSWNILLFRSSQGGGASKIDFARPLITGFGVSRREKQCEVTVDTRDRDSPLGLWQHPDLRGSAHVRFRPKHDVYALGMVLFEIAMWQDLSSFDGREDLLARVLNYSAVVAHRMGTTYRDAMMACLEDEFRWDETGGVQGQQGRMALVFADEVVARLLLCVEGV
ncbi:hypothetical protein MAPG_10264 [Magnaporthiopsis poae ATCC 64411]|uniref:Protein kinase domain-containing protein n=1 Tax=Magnaporthiopsis poae (strain ATCC 64411 / 73-15) TaxID=644358 RepID=A0A0C4EC50_MAGP6|nr:hypothetical protein MAPG_10264 [Magnaporthiopsis poae ATCC 64411]